MKKAFFFIILLIGLCASVANGKKNDSVDERKRKADYIFMESQVRYEDNSIGDYFNMLRYARELDPSDNFYNKELGFFLTILGQQESELDDAVSEEGLRMLQEGYERDPLDYYSAVRYASICKSLGKTDESIRVMKFLKENYPQKPDVALNYSQMLFSRGDSASIHEALDVLSELERSQGHSLGLTSQKVRAYVALGDTTAAEKEISLNIERSPKSVENRLYAGDVYMLLNMPDTAFVHYNNALELDSMNGQVYERLAEYYEYKGDSAAYDREVFNALTRANLEVEDKINLLRGYVQNLYNDENQRPRINRLFEEVTELHPLEVDIRDLYSTYLAVIGNLPMAAEQTSISLDLKPDEITNWNRLISLYIMMTEPKKAVESGQKAIKYFPENPSLKLLTSTAYQLDEQMDSAACLLEQALLQADQNDKELMSEIETSLGDVYYKLNQKDSAFVHYDKALTYNPRNLLAMNNCAYFLACEDKDLDKALLLSTKTLSEDGENSIYLDTYAWIMFKKKNFEEALLYINQTLEADEEPSAEVLEHAGDIYFMNLKPAEALEYWKQALELDPENELLKRKVKEKTYLTE